MRASISLCGTTSAIALALLSQPAMGQTASETPEQQKLPDDQVPVASGNEIVVTGVRQSLETAQAIKRNADQIVDVIAAEDIGKLPDITASASLARIAGIQVTRNAGTAQNVRIRGLPDVSTTYNGRSIFTGSGRNVAIQDFPAASVARLEVYKSSTANLVEPGIAGQVNVVSRKPLDFKGFKLAGSLNMRHFTQSGDVDWNGNLLISDRWDTGIGEIGVLLNGNLAYTDFMDSIRQQSQVIQVAQPSQTDSPGFRFPNSQAIIINQGHRWRPSVNAAVQWRPSGDLELYADGLFQGYRGRDRNRNLTSPLLDTGADLGGPIRFEDVVLEDGTNQAQGFTAVGGRRPEGHNDAFNANTNTYQVGGGAIYNHDRFHASTDVAYSQSTYWYDQANIDFAFARTPVRDVEFDSNSADGGPIFGFRDFNLADPENFVFRGLYEHRHVSKGHDVQARLHLQYDIGAGFLENIQAGIRYDDRTSSVRDGTRYQNVEAQHILYPELPVSLYNTTPGFAFGGTGGILPRTWISPRPESIFENLGELRDIVGFPEGPTPYNQLNTFDANEKSYTGYAQVKYNVDIGFPVDGLIGLRAVRTEDRLDGISRNVEPDPAGGGDVVTFTPVTDRNGFTDLLPNFSARLKFRDDLQLRAAFTKTRTRAAFGQLNPSLNIAPPQGVCDADSPNYDPENCVRTGSGGNPDLSPITSDNYDLSLEYYFARTGSLTLALFRHDVTGFISSFSAVTDDPELGRLRITRPENGGKGRLQGLEMSFHTFFDLQVLPKWARDFGVNANYTYIDHGSELPPEGLGQYLPGLQPVAGVSKHTFNVAGYYETRTFSARLAYHYRSRFVFNYTRVNNPGLPEGPGPGIVSPVMQDGRGILDFSAGITPQPNVTIALNMSNLLATPLSRDRAYDQTGARFPTFVEYLERTVSLGVRFRF
ncbi:TonB-dependent receptor [Stakelama saccharophila]|uniref:TonB-dependent receptor n=1 Tax=Stakelama saccharophila TaxID=3075605 RepID=A0ABZ0B8X2_9SPHN|nr:TonB-dependent receptor [Stakelama sp. W311]WNO53566.1 TonB-dependent receptor [Stakelama sp. W311]